MFEKVENKGRYKTSNPFYWYTRDQDGIDYLFTESALLEGEKRAKKNPEDIPPNLVEPKEKGDFLVGTALGFVVGCMFVSGFWLANFLYT